MIEINKQKKTNIALAYCAFALFCILSAGRDVASEFFFKDQNVHPIAALFVYCATSAVVFVIALRIKHTRLPRVHKADVNHWIQLNIHTVLALATFFLALATPIGAGAVSLVDYASAPIIMGLLGVALLGHKLRIHFFFTSILGLAGIAIIFFNHVQWQGTDFITSLAGISLAILSAFFASMYRIHAKHLLNQGVSHLLLLSVRMVFCSLLLFATMVSLKWSIPLSQLPFLVVIGGIGFALPLYLITFVLSQTSIYQFSTLLFFIPVLTYAVSSLFGYTQFYLTDLLAGAIILAAVVISHKQ